MVKFLRFILFPFSILYDGVTSLRNLFFDVGLLKSTRFDIPIIVVGNLSVGGTGKTPQIEYLIRLLSDKKVAVLSRGYKRETKGFILINSSHLAEDVGDEPLQFFNKFSNISVAVDANRVNGIKQLQKEVNPDVILLDDAFQHRKVTPGFSILLTKYKDLFSDDFLLPTGNLREARRGANRADVIIVTKCIDNLLLTEQERIIEKLNPKSTQKVLFTEIVYNEELKSENKITSISNKKNFEIVLVTGIANPNPLLHYLESKVKKIHHLKFPDHHCFTTSDKKKIVETFDEIKGNKILLTTEKDFTRITGVKDLFYIEIKTQFLEDQARVFDREIIDYLEL